MESDDLYELSGLKEIFEKEYDIGKPETIEDEAFWEENKDEKAIIFDDPWDI